MRGVNDQQGRAMFSMTISEAQARLPDVIARLGKGEEVTITEGTQVVARLVGERSPAGQRPGPGLGKGMLTIVSDDDEHLKEFAEYLP
jgi:antitoxin (DNA-binding transcriptional repressor) of toxin-antitoxin stability system